MFISIGFYTYNLLCQRILWMVYTSYLNTHNIEIDYLWRWAHGHDSIDESKYISDTKQQKCAHNLLNNICTRIGNLS